MPSDNSLMIAGRVSSPSHGRHRPELYIAIWWIVTDAASGSGYWYNCAVCESYEDALADWKTHQNDPTSRIITIEAGGGPP